VHEQRESGRCRTGRPLFTRWAIGWRSTGFTREGRSAVHLVPVKRFEETFDTLVMQRLHSLVPGAYSRAGRGDPAWRGRVERPRRDVAAVARGCCPTAWPTTMAMSPRNGAAERAARACRGPPPGPRVSLSERRRQHRCRGPTACIRERRPMPRFPIARTGGPGDRSTVSFRLTLRRGSATDVIVDENVK